jgi:rod shape-determining protein MreD
MGHERLAALGRVAALILIALTLQTVVISHMTVLGLSVDLFVIFTVIVAATWGSLSGAIFGFAAGMAADIAFLQPLGMRAFVYVLVGYSLGVVAGRFRVTRPRTVFLYTLGSSFVANLMLGLFAYLMGPRAGFFTMLGLEMIPGAALDALVAVPVYVLLVKARVIAMPRAEVGAGGEPVS